MKKHLYITMIALILLLPVFNTAHGKDMREGYEIKEITVKELLQKANLEKEQAQREMEVTSRNIHKNKTTLKTAITDLEEKNRILAKKIKEYEKHIEQLKEEETGLRKSFNEVEGIVKEIVGFARVNARDLSTLINQSPQSAILKDREDSLKGLVQMDRFPTINDMRQMVDLLFSEITLSGEVQLVEGNIIDKKGNETTADILMLGNFTACYQTENETGYALYSDNSERLFALSKNPPSRVNRLLSNYLSGETDTVYIDISKGGVLRQLTHRLNLLEQVPKGGPIVWPILILLVIGTLITLERIYYLSKRSGNEETFMNEVNECVLSDDWTSCRNICDAEKERSIPRVIRRALDFREMSREDMENALQEAILNEIPKLERYMSTLGMLAAIAPLLGLLGTVTGMINTFHIITYYGTGDPKMMSGGISEALVTTMLGLVVAIPLMISHTLLTRRIDTIISMLEEKSVSFVNYIFKSRGAR